MVVRLSGCYTTLAVYFCFIMCVVLFVSYFKAVFVFFFFFSSRRRHTRFDCDWSSDVCSSDLLHTGGVYCWGDNGAGQTGQPASANPQLTPIAVPGVTNAVAIAAGSTHACAILASGGTKC